MRTALGRDGQRGQILVLFTLGIVVLLLIVALVVDGGTAFFNRRDGQNTADLASMSATKLMADTWRMQAPGVTTRGVYGSQTAYQAIVTSMGANNCASGGVCTWTARYVGPRSGANFLDLGPVQASDTAIPGALGGTKSIGVKVSVTRTPHTYFLGIIGQSTWTVNTEATAITGSPTGAPGGQLLPIGFVDPCFGKTPDPNNPDCISTTQLTSLTSGMDGPGNFGWLSWTGSNDPNTLAASICDPDNPSFTLAHEYPGDPGKSNSSGVRACLQKWVDNQETVLIPIVCAATDTAAPCDPATCDTGGHGNGFTFCIKAIAAFKITGFSQPAVDQIVGMFQGTIPYSNGDTVPGGITAPPGPSDATYFLYLAK